MNFNTKHVFLTVDTEWCPAGFLSMQIGMFLNEKNIFSKAQSAFGSSIQKCSSLGLRFADPKALFLLLLIDKQKSNR